MVYVPGEYVPPWTSRTTPLHAIGVHAGASAGGSGSGSRADSASKSRSESESDVSSESESSGHGSTTSSSCSASDSESGHGHSDGAARGVAVAVRQRPMTHRLVCSKVDAFKRVLSRRSDTSLNLSMPLSMALKSGGVIAGSVSNALSRMFPFIRDMLAVKLSVQLGLSPSEEASRALTSAGIRDQALMRIRLWFDSYRIQRASVSTAAGGLETVARRCFTLSNLLPNGNLYASFSRAMIKKLSLEYQTVRLK